MLLGKNGALVILFLAFACADPHPPLTKNAEFEVKKLSVAKIQSPDFRVLQVREESGAIRVEVMLTPSTTSESETRRRTLNALMEIQTTIGNTDRLAVWAYQEDQQKVQGMAFYSPLSEQYHFKTAGELR